MSRRRQYAMIVLLLGVVCAGAIRGAEAPAVPAPKPDAALLEMFGRGRGASPDILFLAPQLTAPPKDYEAIIQSVSAVGTTLEHATLDMEAFCSLGTLPVLQAAKYQIVPVRNVPWDGACERILKLFALREETRKAEDVRLAPLCVLLGAEASPDALRKTLPRLLKTGALVFFAPQSDALPMVLSWHNRIWPGRHERRPVRFDHWIPTLSEIAGVPPPADVAAVSILPLLTGAGYQRPLEKSLRAFASPFPEAETACTMFAYFDALPATLPWVPDFAESRSGYYPAERAFFASALPLSAEVASNYHAASGGSAQGFYLRTVQKKVDFVFPAGVSCVIRAWGNPVFSSWQAQEPKRWTLDAPGGVPLEFFILVPSGIDPATLPIFRREAERPAQVSRKKEAS